MVKRYRQTEIQSTQIQLLGTSQQGRGTLLHFHAQVNVKRNITRSREGRRKPKACLLNVTHRLRLLAQVPQSLDTETRCSLASTARAGWVECPWRVRREHFLLPLLPHRFARGMISPCYLAQLTLLFPIYPLLHTPSFSSTTTKDSMTRSGQAPWQKCFRSETLQMWTHTSYWVDLAMAECLGQGFS